MASAIRRLVNRLRLEERAMSAAIKTQLIELSHSLAVALEDGDWDRLVQLDDCCRALVARVTAAEVERDPDLLLRLKLLLEAYQGLVIVAEEQKQCAAAACRKQSHIQRGVRAYMQFQ